MINAMAFAISAPTSSLWQASCSSHSGGKSLLSVLYNSAVSVPQNGTFKHVKGIPQMGFGPFCQWNGLKQLGISISQYSVKMERKKKYKGKGVYASLFGVGAPEALVIGVVALLVFGPKGLAEVARNLGKTLRAFQPTIRELQEVSREFKSSLEREIGLDEIDRTEPRYTSRPTSEGVKQDSATNVKTSESTPENNESLSEESGAYTADEYLKVTEAQLKAARAQMQKEQKHDEAQNLSETHTPSQDTPEGASSVIPPSENPESNALQEAAPKPQNET